VHLTATLTIPKEHPAFAGHFPGTPILPGVLLLDETLRALERADGSRRWRIAAAKFLKPVVPGEQLQVQHESQPNGSVRFQIVSAGVLVATGTLLPAHSSAGPGHAD
jgi:3-hydroxymyristoyl/3-hydroxydecanoyl-(acyl carrier protein) dehydratase